MTVHGQRGFFANILLQVQVADAAEGIIAQLVLLLRLRGAAG